MTIKISGLADITSATFIDPINAWNDWNPTKAKVSAGQGEDDSYVLSGISLTDHPTVLQLTVE